MSREVFDRQGMRPEISHLKDAEMQEFLEFAIDLARLAGDRTVANRRSAQVISRDLQQGLVTDAELDNTKFIVNRIRERFPTHGIHTEELEKAGRTSSDSRLPEFEWIIDEIDGTNNYSRGLGKEEVDSPDWSVSIGLRRSAGEGLIGVVYAPDHGTLYYGAKNKGAFMEKSGKIIPLGVSGAESKDRFVMSFNVNIAPDVLANIIIGIGKSDKVNKLKPRIRESSALELCYVAGGTDDAFLHTKTQPHDVVAGLVIAGEAGAHISLVTPQTLLVSNGQIHQTLETVTRAAVLSS